MVTARGEDYDRIMGLDTGADDYIVKPFSPGEVMARVRAILRRLQPVTDEHKQVYNHDDLYIDLDSYETKVAGEVISLSKRETELLWLLVNHPNKVFTRENLLDSLWGYEYEGDIRTVDSHIKRLRAAIRS